MRKIFLFFISAFFLFVFPQPIFAQDNLNIYFFRGEGCPHCAKAEVFLNNLEKQYPIKVLDFEIYNSKENRDLMIKAGQKLNTKVTGVPFIVIGDKTITGYLSDEVTGKEIEGRVKACLDTPCPDLLSDVVSVNQKNPTPLPNKSVAFEKSVDVPILGSIQLQNLSLPVITLVLAGLDGFNPCAMWTLLFLITLLIGMEDKKRMWILGSAFIISSATVYFMFMSAWLNLILFIGFVVWMRVVIGAVALAGGGYNLREYFVNKDGACKVTGTEKRKRVFESLKQITREKSFILALGGIILLAAIVNLVELVCSAGLPVVYTQILALNNLNFWQHYLYLLFYIFIFMLDDLLVFIMAMKTLEITGITTKYTRISHLIGGVLMLIVGLLLIFKPEVLMF